MPPAPSTATSSSAAGLSVPLTQNTAPAIKFQCLFTHDIRRKAKRFQDGFLRFHTFNKRIMVYDVSGNFVGDLHWQSSLDPQDGDEFELERGGVLVQVLECLETTETDLTPLLEKKNRPTATSAMGSPPRQGNAPSPQPSCFSSNSLVQYPAGRLKPLSQVLGSKQTRVGRGSLPSKSPFEARHDNRSDGGAAKRQKRTAAHDKENIENKDAAECRSEPPREHSELDKRSISRQSDSSAAPNASTTSGFQPASSIEITSTRKAPPSRRKTSSKEPSGQQKSIADVFAVESTANKLPFATKKPRNKLMCKDLLSASATEKGAKQRKDRVGSNIKRESAKSCQTNNLPPDPIILSDDEDRPVVATKDSAPMSTEGEIPLAFIPSVSTMQALEETAVPPSSQRNVPISNFFKPSTSRPPPQELPNLGHERASNGPRRSDNPMSESRILNRSHSDIIPVPPEADPQQQSLRKPLQKSFSDVSNLRPRNTNIASSVTRSVQPKIPSMTATGIDQASSLEQDERERGPWTSEALDLFDWWPPGRPKPP